jgi:Holliday junction resolvase RusA-like endonuclease
VAKRPHKITFRLPPYRSPRNAWRLAIHASAQEAAEKRSVEYGTHDRLEVNVRLHFPADALTWHDVDNRLKDVLDALQGRAGGPKQVRRLRAIIPNDSQVFRVTIEKAISPKQSLEKGHVVVRRFRPVMRGTARSRR